MPIQYVNIGINPNDGTGDDLRSAFLKVNDNFQLLASIGGETNTGSNIGGGSGQVFASKINEILRFRTLAAGTGITVNQSGDVITIANSVSSQSAFAKIIGGNDTPNEYLATSSTDSFTILGGLGPIKTRLSGSTLYIDNEFEVVDDLAPVLGGSLTLNSKNIIGTGNINITGAISSTSITAYTGTINGNLGVTGVSTLHVTNATVLTATTSISSPSITATTYGFIGDLTGDTTGTHFGNVSYMSTDPGTGDPIAVAIVDADTQTITGNHFGAFDGTISGSLKSPGLDLGGFNISGVGQILVDGTFVEDSNPIVVNSYFYSPQITSFDTPTITYGGATPIFTMEQQTFKMSEALKLRSVSFNSTQTMPLGTSIAFESINTIDIEDPGYDPLDPPTQPEYLLHGYVGVLNHREFPDASGVNRAIYSLILDTTATVTTSVPHGLNDGDEFTFIDTGVSQFGTTTYYAKFVNSYKIEIFTNVGLSTPLDASYFDEYVSGGYVHTTTSVLDNDLYSTFVAQVRSKTNANEIDYLRDVIVARGDGRVTVSHIDIKDAVIRPGVAETNLGTAIVPIPYDLILKTDLSDRYINFYGTYNDTLITLGGGNAEGRAEGGYSFPRNIGEPGQVLSVGVPGSNLLVWNDPGTGGGGGGATYFINLDDVPNSYVPSDAGKILRVKSTYDGVEFASSISATVTGTLIGNASTATALQTTRTINGKNFNGTQNVTLSTSDIAEGTNEYYTNTKVRNAISVTASKSLTYTASTGVFDIAEDTANTINTLVKRDGSGVVTLGTAKVSTLQKNTGDTYITISSPVDLTAAITSNSNITTSTTVSAGFLTLTGTGDQTLASTAKIILNPSTSVDVSNKKIINLADPSGDQEAATKKYVDDTAGAVYDDSIQTLSVQADSGDPVEVTKADTLTVTGSTNIITSKTSTGIQVSLKSSISGVSVSGNWQATGNIVSTTGYVRGGTITISGSEVTQVTSGNPLNLIPGTGSNVVVSGGDLKLQNARLLITGFNDMAIAALTEAQVISLTTATTFVTTDNWNTEEGGLAYADIGAGQPGQVKTIIMRSRGTYGNALDTRPRYLVLSGNINGSSRTINIAASDPNGSSTFMYLDGSWWRIANVA